MHLLILAKGVIPASADSGPLPLERWASRVALHATLAKEAPTTANPVPLTDANVIAGIQLYGEHCADLPRHLGRRRLRQPHRQGRVPDAHRNSQPTAWRTIRRA